MRGPVGGYLARNLNILADQALSALTTGGDCVFPLIDGRMSSVKPTPEHGTSFDMAIGVAVLPAAAPTPEHSHRAEQIDIVMRGAGVISISDEAISVSEGSVVVTPPHLPPLSSASSDAPLVAFWAYGTAGSEARWLAE